jgi:hypothetical protein
MEMRRNARATAPSSPSLSYVLIFLIQRVIVRERDK